MNSIVFIDSEITVDGGKILDLGAVKPDRRTFHSSSVKDFISFISDCDYICGHNIVNHDYKYIGKFFDAPKHQVLIDTLALSPLLFPQRPYHALLKDDKLQSDELNNPLNDSIKAMELFNDEVNAFNALPYGKKWVYTSLLYPFPQFKGFFDYNKSIQYPLSAKSLKEEFSGKICLNSDIAPVMKKYPVELAYALALIWSGDKYSITPPWVLKNYPRVEDIINMLCGTPCAEGCPYCSGHLNVTKELKRFFGYDSFRTYDGEPLQEKAADAAVHSKSLLAVFPTGGGKSVTFQLPALIAGETVRGLTVVISPLQSLMKDQVDNLEDKGIADAVTINGMLSPIERAEAVERVASGIASLLYISPELLRSNTIEKLLLSRNIARFVIDEAHCFSAWGQDFRVDYLYIGDFLKELQNKKGLEHPIPVSCFTATAKQKVITDIKDYFKSKSGLDLELYTTSAVRENLRYEVWYKESEAEKYNALRSLIEQKNCPTIIYVSRTRRTLQLAEKLASDGFPAKPFNGKMEVSEKIANQEAFIRNEVKIIVATSAFGMGVDKKDVKLVIHYDISDSLENYVQEAGRAGRDPSLQAECYVLFNDNDLDKHFILLNQTKLSIGEIQQVWKAIKDLTKTRARVCCSPLEIARQAGWNDAAGQDIEVRVRTAVAALENAGYIKRGKNVPHVYATSILAKNMKEASDIINASALFDDKQRENAMRIIKSLISSRSIAKAGNNDGESRVDYLADILGLPKDDVVNVITLMREDGLLEDSRDMSAYIRRADSQNKSTQILERFARLEGFMIDELEDGRLHSGLREQKELNERAISAGVPHSSAKNIRTVLYYWTIKNYIRKTTADGEKGSEIVPMIDVGKLREKFDLRIDICRFLVEELYRLAKDSTQEDSEEMLAEFSLIGLWKSYCDRPRFNFNKADPTPHDVEDAILYLSKIGALTLEGGFLVLYSGMEIKRIVTDNKIRYKLDDYRMLSEFYKQKIQQIHIVGEYAHLMVRDYNAALQFVQDYFQMDFKQFIAKYFKGERGLEIERNITPEKYDQLFAGLSETQTKIINDDKSECIVIAAGPGSGKTKVLVHKLASLLLLEEVKHEQLLMVTFSRAAATEFKKRLIQLIGNAAAYIEIRTFHSYCFDLLGRIGSLEGVKDVVKNAAEMIYSGEVELGRITKTVVVIDEAQDMDESEFALIEALMSRNDDMRIIAVGDDDQNIYEFRGSDSKYMRSFITNHNAAVYEMTGNYRSAANIVALANEFAASISYRMKRTPCFSVQGNNGKVKLIKHIGSNLEEPIVRGIMSSHHEGKICVLTNTNEEALRVLGLLNKYGVRAKLIQSNDGFSLYNLAEIRFFLKQIDKRIKFAKIPDEVWGEAKQKLSERYGTSGCFYICQNLLSEFEEVNPNKYRSDLDEFIRESNLEDFYGDDKQSVTVSTIHKSKGREFDVVYMLLNNVNSQNDKMKRRLYVGLTRAKRELYIHYNNDIFDRFAISGTEHIFDRNLYPAPSEIILQMGHKDVVLDFFKGKKELIFKLQSGSSLAVDSVYLTAEIDAKPVHVLKFSKACVERLENLYEKGYQPYKAYVRFIVAWKDENDDKETAVILPEIYLKL